MSAKDLEEVRASIDELDQRLVALLKERKEKVAKAASLKKELGLSAYSNERASYVLNHCEELARESMLPEGMMTDIMRRILRESYRQCSDSEFKYPRLLKEEGDVVIVGGNGGMGML